MLSDMHNYFLSAITCLSFLHAGLLAEKCSQNVVGKRDTVYVPAGDSLSLSCGVQHCGEAWTGNWMWRHSTDEKEERAVKDSVRQTKVMLSANESQLILNFLSVSQLDEGSYGCYVKWDNGETAKGNLIYVNVTAAVPTQRTVLHRLLVCAGAFLCLPIILGLARCLSSEVKHQPLPRTQSTHVAVCTDQPHPAPQPLPRCPVPKKRTTPPHKALRKSQQNTEVVYADISQDALRKGATRETEQSTVYSSVRFS